MIFPIYSIFIEEIIVCVRGKGEAAVEITTTIVITKGLKLFFCFPIGRYTSFLKELLSFGVYF